MKNDLDSDPGTNKEHSHEEISARPANGCAKNDAFTERDEVARENSSLRARLSLRLKGNGYVDQKRTQQESETREEARKVAGHGDDDGGESSSCGDGIDVIVRDTQEHCGMNFCSDVVWESNELLAQDTGGVVEEVGRLGGGLTSW